MSGQWHYFCRNVYQHTTDIVCPHRRLGFFHKKVVELLGGRIITLISVFFLFFGLIDPVPAAQNERRERGAFLKYKVESASGLVSQLSANPAIAARYARHFGISVEEVKHYFANNLKLITIKQAQRSTIYFVGKNGAIVSGTRLLPAESRVFVNQKNQLILEWRCGNPLLKKLPASDPVTKTKASVETPEQAAPPVDVSADPSILPVQEDPMVQVAAGTPTEIGQLPPPITSALVPNVATTPAITGMEPVVETVAAAPITSVPAVVASSKSGFPWILPILAGGAGALIGGNDSNDEQSPVVPEPSSVIALFSGLAAAGLTWRRRVTR